MQNKKLFILIFLSLNLCFLGVFLLASNLNLSTFLSFEAASFCSLFYISISFLHYKKFVKNAVLNSNFTPKPLVIFLQNQSKISLVNCRFKDYNEKLDLKSKFASFGAFFSLFKFLILGIFVLCFLFLNRANLLSIFAFICGVSCLILSVLIFAFFNTKFIKVKK